MSTTEVRKSETAPGNEPPILKGFGPGRMLPAGKVVKAKDVRATLFRLWGYLQRQRGALILASVLVAMTSVLTLLGPFLLGRAIDTYVLKKDLPGLVRLCGLLLGIYLLTSLLTWSQGFIMAGVAQRTIRAIRDDLFAALQRLPLRFFDTRSHGDLMSRLTNDVENISQVLTDSVTGIVSGLLGLVGSAVLMFVINAPLAAVSVTVIVGLTLLLNRVVAPKTSDGFRRQQAALGKLNGLIEETIGGQKVVKAYHQEGRVLTQFEETNAELRKAATQAQIFAGVVGPFMNGINNLGFALVAGIGGVMAVRGLATVGTIASFINYARQFGRPLTDIANL